MKNLIFIILIVGLISNIFAQAEISPALSDSIKYAIQNNITITAVVVLKDQVDIKKLDKDLYNRKANAKDRAYTVISTLQNKAQNSQQSLLSYLESKSEKEITKYESLWIINAIILKASPEILLEIGERDDIALMDIDHKPIPDPTYDARQALEKSIESAEPGLKVVNAHKLWKLGYTGAGRLVMNRDSGVDGNHPALASRWRGTHVPYQYAWHGSGTFPVDGGSSGHGTHTMGTIAALDTATHDTVGIAFEAEWIAADRTYSVTASFQWAMNPDGNINTIDDIPDVISNSWYFINNTGGCMQSYASLFNAVEAVGIAIVFSAGNAGPASQTITGPKNINTNLVNVFATGRIDGNSSSFPISNSSSRGPSGCGGTGSLLIKPEAVAPGSNVRSTLPGGGYGFLSGTSMSCPHVSGVVALLKQAFPNKTGHEIKLAIYHSAKETPADLAANDPGELAGEVSGEDHTYGNGLIDAFAAYEYLIGVPQTPTNLSVYSDYTTPNSIQLYWTDPTSLLNGDTLTTDSYQVLIERDSVLIDSVFGGTENYSDLGLVDGTEYNYAIYIKIDTSGVESHKIGESWVCGGSPIPSPAVLTSIRGGQNEITLNWTNPNTNVDGTPLDDFDNINLYQDSLLVTSFTRTTTDSGRQDSAIYSPTTPGIYYWNLTVEDNEIPANESVESNILRTPLNIPIVEKFELPEVLNSDFWQSNNAVVDTRGYNPPSGPYVLNLNANPIVSDTVELYPVDLTNMQSMNVTFALQYQPQGTGTEPPEPEDSLFIHFKNENNDWIKITSIPGDSLYPFVKKEFYLDSLSNGINNFFHNEFQLRFSNIGTAHPFYPRDDWFVDNIYLGVPSALISSDRSSIEFDTTDIGLQDTVILEIQNIGVLDFNVTDILGGTGVFSVDTTYFAVLAGSNFKLPIIFRPPQTGMYQGILKILHDVPNSDTLTISLSGVSMSPSGFETELQIPKEFKISQNYPNPFNPTTKIYYELPVSSEVHLEVYDILGKKVKTLVNGKMEAGYYEINWDGSNELNIRVSSGIYIYKFSANSKHKNFNAIKKMIFLK